MDRTCTCGKWEAKKIPCSHLIAICAKYNHDATEFMDCFYHVEERYHSYEPIFQPLKDRLEWPEPEERRIVMPNPRLNQEKGRPKSTRIRNEMDDEEGQEWCKYAYHKFEANQEKVKLHMVRRMSAQQQLCTMKTQSSLLNTGGGAHTHRVSLEDSIWTCGKWEANKIPCSHLIAVCANYNHDATEFMDHFYCVEEWYHSYEPIFQPLKDRLEWSELEERRIVMPNPRLIQEKGRPKSTRIRNVMDEEDRELPTLL